MDLIKTAYMQKTANIILLAATIILASCGATTKDNDEVKEKKAKPRLHLVYILTRSLEKN